MFSVVHPTYEPIGVLKTWHHGRPDLSYLCRVDAETIFISSIIFNGRRYEHDCWRTSPNLDAHPGKPLIDQGKVKRLYP